MSFVECLLGFQNRLSQRLRTRAFGLGPLDKDYRVTEKKRERERRKISAKATLKTYRGNVGMTNFHAQ